MSSLFSQSALRYRSKTCKASPAWLGTPLLGLGFPGHLNFENCPDNSVSYQYTRAEKFPPSCHQLRCPDFLLYVPLFSTHTCRQCAFCPLIIFLRRQGAGVAFSCHRSYGVRLCMCAGNRCTESTCYQKCTTGVLSAALTFMRKLPLCLHVC